MFRLVLSVYRFFIFFFNQKTAYEMRIIDWSSDVCSSDLRRSRRPGSIGGAGRVVVKNTGALAILTRPEGKNETLAKRLDRKSGVKGTSVYVRVDLGGRRILKKKNKKNRDINICTKTHTNYTLVVY